jgi:hypothetical protein
VGVAARGEARQGRAGAPRPQGEDDDLTAAKSSWRKGLGGDESDVECTGEWGACAAAEASEAASSGTINDVCLN